MSMPLRGLPDPGQEPELGHRTGPPARARPIYHPLRMILATRAVRHARRKLLDSARVWLWEEHRMCQLDAARLQFGMISPTHRAVPVSIGLGGSTSLRYWLVRETAATAEAVMAASL